MLAILTHWLSGNTLRLAAWGAAALAVLTVLLGARQAGRNAERADNLLQQTKDMRKANAIQDKNRRTLADGDAAERLHDKWSRD
jgi:hypothetical protein